MILSFNLLNCTAISLKQLNYLESSIKNMWKVLEILKYTNKIYIPAAWYNDTPLIHTRYPIFPPPTWELNWAINKDHCSYLKWRQIYPCHNIHVFYIHFRSKTQRIEFKVDVNFLNVAEPALPRYAEYPVIQV